MSASDPGRQQPATAAEWLRWLLPGLMLLIVASLVGSAPGSGHMAEAACDSCHLAGSETVAATAAKLIATQERLCAGCHPDAVKVSHPSGFRPTSTTAEQLPLDWSGRLTCSSCHRVHARQPGLMRVAERGRDFCILCHDDAFFRAMRDGGESLIRSAHLAASTPLPGLTIDAYSLTCMECHNEQATNQVGALAIDRMGLLSHDASSMNHPIGKPYDQAALYGGYRPRNQLAPDIMLPDGRIGCVSCHAGYSNPHGKVLRSRRGSELCLECHDL